MTWQQLDQHPQYEIFSEYDDSIHCYPIRKSGTNPRILKTYIHRGGYATVYLNDKQYLVHRVIAQQFIVNDDPENKTQVDHIDHDRLNNRINNLRWVSNLQNTNNKSKYKDRDVDFVQELPDDVIVINQYGNYHFNGYFFGDLDAMFDQIHGKEISYNNLQDIAAAVELIDEYEDELTFAILKHNNACGLASRPTVLEAWKDALAGDPVSAFGGVLVTNAVIDRAAAEEINKIFFEVIIAPDYDVDALEILDQKKNRIILVRKPLEMPKIQFRSMLNGVLVQDRDLKQESPEDLTPVTDKQPTDSEVEDMLFANKIVKQSKSNAIVLAKNKQLLASGVGQTSRVDALKQAIEKAKGFGFDLNGAVMASDAFFPFPDCVELAAKEGITAVIQPGGSIRDKESVDCANEHGLSMVTTGFRHFKH